MVDLAPGGPGDKEGTMEKPRRRRLTKEEMEGRLDLVHKLRLRGLSFSVIGKTLDIDKSMVCRDLQRLRKMKEKK